MTNGTVEKYFRDHQINESSWCWSCASRDKCQIKEAVAFEEMRLPGKLLNVQASCKGYIHNPSAVKPPSLIDMLKG